MKRKREKRKTNKKNAHTTNINLETGSIKIYNLSKHILTPEEEDVLKKGLKYAPLSKYDPFNTFVDLKKFIRKVTLKKFFATQRDKEEEIVENQWRVKSTFFPIHAKGCFVESFEKIMVEEIKKLERTEKKRKFIKTNITKKEKKSIKKLERK